MTQATASSFTLAETAPTNLACDKHVIVCSSYGSFTVYPCTLDNARALLAENEPERRLSKEVLELAHLSKENNYRVTTEMLLRAMQEVMRLGCGEVSPALTRLVSGPRPRPSADTEPDTTASGYVEHRVTQALKDEVTLWCVRRQLNPLSLGYLEAVVLNKDADLDGFSLLQGVRERAKGRTLRFVQDADLQTAEEYRQLTQGSWKPQAKADRVVQRYLNFINDWLCDRETRYHVAELKPKV